MSKKVLFVTNIGSRDIEIQGIILLESGQKEKRFKDITKDIFDNFDEYYEKINLPILDKVLKEIFSEQEKIDNIILIATDQEDNIHNHTDTIYAAEIIKKYLQKKYPQKFVNNENFQKIPQGNKKFEIKLIKTNPHDPDTMLHFYKEDLFNKKLQHLKQDASAYVSITSGIAAMNMGLTFSSIEFFEGNCNLIHASTSSNFAQLLNLPEKITTSIKIKELKILIKNYQYFSSALLLDEIKISQEKKNLLKSLIKYAGNRYCFNFKKGITDLKNPIKNSIGEEKKILSNFQNELHDPSREFYLKELIYNSEIKLRNAEYADFVGRIFNFNENIGKLIVSRLGVKIQKNGAIESYLYKNPDLCTYLTNKFVEKNGFDLKRALNKDSCYEIIEFFNKNHEYDDITSNMKKIIKLSNLRNESIIAHSFKGISKEKLRDTFGDDPEKIRECLKSLYYFAINEEIKEQNPFDKINELILENLD